MTALADRVRRASMFSGINTILMRLANIVVMAAVARLIAPDQFGVFALTMVAFGVVQAIGELGLTAAISRADLDLDEIAPTVVTLALASSVAWAALLALFAPSLAVLLGSAQATLPLQIMAICVLIGGPISVFNQQLQREFRGDLIFRANLIAFGLATASLVVFALMGEGAVAFALSRVVSLVTVGVVMFTMVPTRYRPGFSLSVARTLLPFGLPVAISGLLAQVVLNVDFVFVSQLLSVYATGLYSLAFNVSTWSTAVLQATLSSVVLPAFSRVLAHEGDAGAAMRRAVEATVVLAFPLAAATSALAGPLILVVYGERWAEAAPVLAILSVFGATSVIGVLLSDVLIASGRTAMMAIVQAGALILLIPLMWGGIQGLGLVGAGLAHMLVVLFGTLPLYLLAIWKAIRVKPAEVLRPAGWPLISAITAGSAAYLVTLQPMPDPLRLVLGAAVLGAVYLLMAARAMRRLLPDGDVSDGGLHRLLGVVAWPADKVIARRRRRVRVS